MLDFPLRGGKRSGAPLPARQRHPSLPGSDARTVSNPRRAIRCAAQRGKSMDLRAPMRWRILTSEPAGGAENMALDQALMERAARTGEAVLRIYGWSRPTLSLGRNQPARGRYDEHRAGRLGVEFVRRPTGGRALLHDREVTYSVSARAERLGGLRESYRRINRLLVDGLRSLGADVSVAEPPGTGGSPAPDLAPCFERPVPGEIVAGGRKLVGSAQVRDGGALLQHGSILIEDDQALATVLRLDASPPPPPAATLESVLGRAPAPSEIAGCLVRALERIENACAEPLELDDRLDAAMCAALTRYRDPEWTWRR